MTDTPQGVVPSQEAAMSSDIVERLRAALIQASGDDMHTEEAEYYLQVFQRAGLELRDKDAADTDQIDHITALEAKLAEAREAWSKRAGTVEVTDAPVSYLKIYFDSKDAMRDFNDALRSLAEQSPAQTQENES